MLSVVIITKNEEKHIADCLSSVSFANEIIIVDNNSDDKTIELSQPFLPKVKITEDWPGFGAQKQRALDMATQEWVLSIDADERVSEQLREEILSVIESNNHSAYQIPRQSSYCGRWINHSGWSPDYVLRLFRRDSAKFSQDLVHEKVELKQGSMGTLTHPFKHFSYESVEEVLDKTNRYSTANALKSYQKGKKSSLSKALLHGFWAFFRTYIIRAGFLDGREGVILAISNAETSYYRYIKLMYLQEKSAR